MREAYDYSVKDIDNQDLLANTRVRRIVKTRFMPDELKENNSVVSFRPGPDLRRTNTPLDSAGQPYPERKKGIWSRPLTRKEFGVRAVEVGTAATVTALTLTQGPSLLQKLFKLFIRGTPEQKQVSYPPPKTQTIEPSGTPVQVPGVVNAKTRTMSEIEASQPTDQLPKLPPDK